MGRYRKKISILAKASHSGALISDEDFGKVSLKSDKSTYPRKKFTVFSPH